MTGAQPGDRFVLPWQVTHPTRVALADGQVDELVAMAGALADAARPITLAGFRSRDLAVQAKPGPDFDPVTAADRAAEQAMRDLLADRRPDDGIVGEEGGQAPGSSGLTWVLDPIDGTRAYIAGLPTWGMLIAVFDGVEPVVGVIDQPFTDERFVGIATPQRRMAWLVGADTTSALTAAGATDIHDAVLHTTFPEVGTDVERAAFDRVRDRVRLTRYGADCYAYALVAAGTIDVVVEAGLAPWDAQALIPVIRGAGGVITAWDGTSAHGGGRVVAAANPVLHATTRGLLTP